MSSAACPTHDEPVLGRASTSPLTLPPLRSLSSFPLQAVPPPRTPCSISTWPCRSPARDFPSSSLWATWTSSSSCTTTAIARDFGLERPGWRRRVRRIPSTGTGRPRSCRVVSRCSEETWRHCGIATTRAQRVSGEGGREVRGFPPSTCPALSLAGESQAPPPHSNACPPLLWCPPILPMMSHAGVGLGGGGGAGEACWPVGFPKPLPLCCAPTQDRTKWNWGGRGDWTAHGVAPAGDSASPPSLPLPKSTCHQPAAQ